MSTKQQIKCRHGHRAEVSVGDDGWTTVTGPAACALCSGRILTRHRFHGYPDPRPADPGVESPEKSHGSEFPAGARVSTYRVALVTTQTGKAHALWGPRSRVYVGQKVHVLCGRDVKVAAWIRGGPKTAGCAQCLFALGVGE